jgi:DNA-binding NtrC family response regulator
MLRLRTIKGSTIKVHDALSPGALRRVMEYEWPGNFRDLESFIERLPSTSRAQSIDAGRLQLCVARRSQRGPYSLRESEPSSEGNASQWEDLVGIALAAFVRDHGQQPKSWGQITQLTERYIKPVFIAHATGLTQIDENSQEHQLLRAGAKTEHCRRNNM